MMRVFTHKSMYWIGIKADIEILIKLLNMVFLSGNTAKEEIDMP